MRILTTLLLFAALAPAQDAPRPARIEGRVVNGAGEPVPRAQVTLQGRPAPPQPGQLMQRPGAYSATTDGDGRFVIENIPPAEGYQLLVERTGFVTARSNGPLTLAAGESVTNLGFTLIQQGVITGRITDQNGDPRERVQVQLLRGVYTATGRQFNPAASATTNDQGEYRIAGIAPGRYLVVAQEQNLPAMMRQAAGPPPENVNLPTYYPNGATPQEAAALDITPGAELRGIDIRMRRGREYLVRGRVLDASGTPVAGVMLRATPLNSGANAALNMALRGPIQSRADGSFEIRGLAPGRYVLQSTNATVNGVEAPRLPGRLEFQITSQDLADLEFRATLPATVSGALRVEGGELAGQRLTVAITAVEAPFPDSFTSPVGEDGSWKLANVTPGRYRLSVASPPGTYVKSARAGGVDLLRTPLDVVGSVDGVAIVLSAKAPVVTGSVRDDPGAPRSGLNVTLWPRAADAGLTSTTRITVTDHNGAFRIQGARPGAYYLAAWEEIEPGLNTVPEFLAQFTGDAMRVELEEGASLNVDLKPVPAARIRAAQAKLP